MKFIYRCSKIFHKYLGLLLSLFLLWMGASGILINHPGLLKKVALSKGLLPRGYQFENWNRGAFRDGLIPAPGAVVVGGKQGIWLSRDSGRSFSPLNQGLCEKRDVLCLAQDPLSQNLYAGTGSGVYELKIPPGFWETSGAQGVWHPLDGLDHGLVNSLFFMDNTLLAATRSGLFQRVGTGGFSPFSLPDLPLDHGSISLAGLILSIHDGSILGLPGKLVVDLAGLVLAFLSFSGVYVWFMGGRLGLFKGRRPYIRLFRFCYSRHLKWGIWFSLILIPITITGFLVRPPFLILLYKYMGSHIETSGAPGANPWEGQIHKATYHSGSLLVSTRRGFYEIPVGPDGRSLSPPESLALPIRISGMGTTVLKSLSEKEFLVGSFAGMARLDTALNRVWASPPRTRVAAALTHGGGILGYLDFHHGYRIVKPSKAVLGTLAPPALAMPSALNEGGKTTLWFLMFELHNGRIFSGLLGAHTWMIIPLGGLLCLFTLFTGCFDWAYRKGYLRFPLTHKIKELF